MADDLTGLIVVFDEEGEIDRVYRGGTVSGGTQLAVSTLEKVPQLLSDLKPSEIMKHHDSDGYVRWCYHARNCRYYC